MSAPKTDIIELDKNYVPMKGEKIWLVFKPTWGWSMLKGRNWLYGWEATQALAKARRKLKDDFSDSYALGNKVKIVEAERPTSTLQTGGVDVPEGMITEIHILLIGTGTPPVLFLIGLTITVLGLGAITIISDRVYKTVEASPVVVGMGMAGVLGLVGLAFIALRKFRPGA